MKRFHRSAIYQADVYYRGDGPIKVDGHVTINRDTDGPEIQDYMINHLIQYDMRNYNPARDDFTVTGFLWTDAPGIGDLHE